VAAGASAGIITLPFCVSAGVLVYAPLGPAYVGVGAAAGILCAVAGGVAGALARTSSFVPNVPSTPMALIQASFVAALLSGSGGDPVFALALAPLSIALAGLLQGLIALSGLARAVKFTPYPVLAGFVTGLAIRTLVQQVPVLFHEPDLGALISALMRLEVPAPAMPAFGLALLGAMLAVERAAPRVPVLLVGLFGGTALFQLVAAAWPALDMGGVVGSVSLADATFGFDFSPTAFGRIAGDAAMWQSLLLTAVTIALLGTLDLTFALRSAQNLGDVDLAPRRNLAAQGLSNVAAAATGGVAVSTSLGFAITIFDAGGRTRVSTLSAALVLLVAALAAPKLIGALPNVVLVTTLIYIAFKVWDPWCVAVLVNMLPGREQGVRVRARRNAAIVLAVMGATVLGQPVAGALVGVVLSCLVFIMEMSRPVIRRGLDGRRIASKRIRSQADAALLREAGDRLAILQLQGVLFFGNADDLASEIRALEGRADTIILDLRRVTDLDTSGATILRQVGARCAQHGILLIAAGASPDYADLVADALPPGPDTRLFPDLDAALEFAENAALRTRSGRRDGVRALRLDQTDFASGLSADELQALARVTPLCRFEAGQALCRAGEPADRLWLIACGSVSIRVHGSGAEKRLAALGPGTSVGEMGLIDRRPRSADVVADEDVTAYVLRTDDFDALLREKPALGQSLLATIARVTAERLRATSEELRLAET
jgi:MFS superfamily sulfate permease-like transporter